MDKAVVIYLRVKLTIERVSTALPPASTLLRAIAIINSVSLTLFY